MKELTVEEYFLTRMKRDFPEVQIHKYEVRRSEPDRICLFPGAVARFVELKRPGKELRPDQVRAAERLKKLGFDVRKLDTKAEVDNYIRQLRSSETFI